MKSIEERLFEHEVLVSIVRFKDKLQSLLPKNYEYLVVSSLNPSNNESLTYQIILNDKTGGGVQLVECFSCADANKRMVEYSIYDEDQKEWTEHGTMSFDRLERQFDQTFFIVASIAVNKIKKAERAMLEKEDK